MTSQLSRYESRTCSLVPEDHEWDRAPTCLLPRDPQILTVTFCGQLELATPSTVTHTYLKINIIYI